MTKVINFKFHHLISSNTTFIDKEFEDKKKYLKILKVIKISLESLEIIIDHVFPEKNLSLKKLKKFLKKKFYCRAK